MNKHTHKVNEENEGKAIKFYWKHLKRMREEKKTKVSQSENGIFSFLKM